MELIHQFQIMILLAIIELVYSIYVMYKTNDDEVWHQTASKMLLLALMVVAIRSIIIDKDTTLMLVWVSYFIFLMHKGNREFLERCNRKGENNGSSTLST